MRKTGNKTKPLSNSAYIKILKKAQGSWADDSWEDSSENQAEVEKEAAEHAKKT